MTLLLVEAVCVAVVAFQDGTKTILSILSSPGGRLSTIADGREPAIIDQIRCGAVVQKPTYMRGRPVRLDVWIFASQVVSFIGRFT